MNINNEAYINDNGGKDIQLYRVKAKSGFAYYTFDSAEDLVFEMAAKGYSCKGFIPIKIGSYGSIVEYDLIFEKEE
ncbi:MAG: hypothetical protein IKF68_00090 [Erysipelotrichaceae bacterium]|nr:hypothetical protein [Erysipelotrichaceae bacterium]